MKLNREIKFRGLTSNGEWVYGLVSHMPKHNGSVNEGYYISSNKGRPFAHKVYPQTIGQSTGSVDRNGNEIYEGDIVLLDEGFYPRKRPIVFSEYGAWYIGELGISFGQMKADGFIHCEVIGNIHENPNLLD